MEIVPELQQQQPVTPVPDYLVSVHQMAPDRRRWRTSNCSLLLIYLPRKDKRLSRPGWLTYKNKRRCTHISGQLQVERRTESSPVKDQPCGRLSWLPFGFLLHVKYSLSYRMVTFYHCVMQPVSVFTKIQT